MVARACVSPCQCVTERRVSYGLPGRWLSLDMLTRQLLTVDTVYFSTSTQKWLLNMLESANTGNTIEYVVVVGYYPVVSNGQHGDLMYNTPLHAMLTAHKVSAYISSADHSLQHIQQDGTDFFVTGAWRVELNSPPLSESY